MTQVLLEGIPCTAAVPPALARKPAAPSAVAAAGSGVHALGLAQQRARELGMCGMEDMSRYVAVPGMQLSCMSCSDGSTCMRRHICYFSLWGSCLMSCLLDAMLCKEVVCADQLIVLEAGLFRSPPSTQAARPSSTSTHGSNAVELACLHLKPGYQHPLGKSQCLTTCNVCFKPT
jgi:hypothetical protein